MSAAVMTRARVAGVALVSVASAAAYAALRLPAAADAHRSFASMCAKLEMAPRDWPCRVTFADAAASTLGGALLVWLGLALAAALVAASGRRVAWTVPLLPLAAIPGAAALLALWDGSARPGAMLPLLGQSSSWAFAGTGPTFWERHWEAIAGLDLLLIGLPALAIVLLLRPAPRPHRPPVWAFRTALWAAFGGASIVIWLAQRTQVMVGNAEDTLVPAAVIGLAGVLSGHRRRWLPWTVVPLAVLLSGGPAAWALASVGRFTYLGRFGAVAPLAAVGLIGALVMPLASRLARRRGSEDSTPHESVQVVQRRGPRPAALALGLSLGMLGVAGVMWKADPSGVEMATPLPTYLGVREAVEAGRPYPVDRLCDDADDGAITLCRAVQKMLRTEVG